MLRVRNRKSAARHPGHNGVLAVERGDMVFDRGGKSYRNMYEQMPQVRRFFFNRVLE